MPLVVDAGEQVDLGLAVSLLEGDPKSLPREHGMDSLEELFIAVARKPLALERT